ncbi:MAG: hypothetical protein QMD92_00085 [bacterium]|nr:hypothetical protein [bacterium]
MKKTILTCDRCKKRVANLYEVGAGLRHYCTPTYPTAETYEVYQLVAEWCLDCCIEVGFTRPVKSSKAAPLDPEPTLEDIIRKIVKEEISNGT